MRHNILGDLELVGSERVSIAARKQGVVLATLLAKPEQIVSRDHLVNEIWGHTPPRRATASLYVYVSQLRKLLATFDDGSTIRTCDPGYSIHIGVNNELDYKEFCHLAETGRDLQQLGQFEEAARYLRDALAQWRGPAFRDLRNGPIVGALANWLDELRVESAERLVMCRFRLGQHRESISVLSEFTAEYPLNERFHQQLMHAYYLCNRRADALRAYQTARRTLRDELGLDPCRELQDLHQAIIVSAEPRLSA